MQNIDLIAVLHKFTEKAGLPASIKWSETEEEITMTLRTRHWEQVATLTTEFADEPLFAQSMLEGWAADAAKEIREGESHDQRNPT